jgi:hypothetical protein
MWLRLRQVAALTTDLEHALDELRDVLGIEVCHRDPAVDDYGLENALLPIGNTILEVLAPTRKDTAGGRYIARRGGDTGYMAIMQTDEHAARKKHVQDLGIRIVGERDRGGYHFMQLHPRDTGGTFYEIDEQYGTSDAYDADGPWGPAGPDWKAARKLDVVSGVTALEIQCDDPETVAARWTEIAQLPVTRETRGAAMVLENATIYFVPITDGRPEGLSAMDVHAVDRNHIIEAAKRRGVYLSESQAFLCGMRVNLV